MGFPRRATPDFAPHQLSLCCRSTMTIVCSLPTSQRRSISCSVTHRWRWFTATAWISALCTAVSGPVRSGLTSCWPATPLMPARCSVAPSGWSVVATTNACQRWRTGICGSQPRSGVSNPVICLSPASNTAFVKTRYSQIILPTQKSEEDNCLSAE